MNPNRKKPAAPADAPSAPADAPALFPCDCGPLCRDYRDLWLEAHPESAHEEYRYDCRAFGHNRTSFGSFRLDTKCAAQQLNDWQDRLPIYPLCNSPQGPVPVWPSLIALLSSLIPYGEPRTVPYVPRLAELDEAARIDAAQERRSAGRNRAQDEADLCAAVAELEGTNVAATVSQVASQLKWSRERVILTGYSALAGGAIRLALHVHTQTGASMTVILPS